MPVSVLRRPNLEPRAAVLHVVHSLDGGGTERTLAALLGATRGDTTRHLVATLRHPGEFTERLPDHVACRPLHLVGRSHTAGVRLAVLARRRRVAVLHARNTGCWADALIARLLTPKLRLVLGYHGRESMEPFSTRVKLAAQFGILLGARFSTVSHSGRDELCRHLSIPESGVDVMENGVDLRRFAPAKTQEREQIRTALGLDVKDFVMGAVGSLTLIKRQDVLLRAVAQARTTIPQLRTLLIGDGPQRQELSALAKQLGLEETVGFLGQRQDVAQLLKALDGFVCTSDYECLSNSVLEAMATGLPVVATDVGENSRLVRREREGVLVRPGDIQSVVDALTTLANDEARRRRLGEAARLRAEDFDFARTVAQYEAYYEALSQPSPPEPPYLLPSRDVAASH